MRFISPDGLPLAQLLDNRDSQGNNQPSRSGRKSRKGKVDQRWSRSTTTSSWLPGAHSEADAIELNVNLLQSHAVGISEVYEGFFVIITAHQAGRCRIM
jgi:hypothetical protein